MKNLGETIGECEAQICLARNFIHPLDVAKRKKFYQILIVLYFGTGKVYPDATCREYLPTFPLGSDHFTYCR